MFIPCSAALGATAISTLASSSFSAGMDRAMLAAAGNHQAEFVALMRQLSRGQISTRNLAALIAVTSQTANIVFRNVAQGGVGTTTYKSLAGGATTLCVPKRINWNAGSPATLDIELIFLSSNGSTAPVTVGNVAGNLTAETDVWTGAGTGIYMINVDFGHEITIPPDGNLYPINAFVLSERPVIQIGYYDETQITQAAIQPGAIGTLVASFAKIADGGVRGAARTYSLTGHVHVDSATGSKPGAVVVTCAGKGTITIG